MQETSKSLFKRSEYYTEFSSIQEALAGGDVVLIKGSWLVEHHRTARRLPRRQEVPQDAIWNSDAALAALEKRETYVVAISYSWLTKVHPDPDSIHLQTLAFLIKPFARHKRVSMDNLAIFIDWCSLYQEPRTQEEKIAFMRSLQHINLWYAHAETEVWMLTYTPEDVTPYERRGWPTFEVAISTMISDSTSVLDIGLLPVDFGTQKAPRIKDWADVVKACQGMRSPPFTPDDFKRELDRKIFTNQSDAEMVCRKYSETFKHVMGSVEQLWLDGLRWVDSDVKRLTKVLPHCGVLIELHLEANNITGCGVDALVAALSKCSKLEVLGLDGNNIDPTSAERLRTAWIDAGKKAGRLDLENQEDDWWRTSRRAVK